ncbi:unnamed protein product [Closterium sp. NIES-65]|nr:unnamed protein product [Closterium sp. NIES-65]
MNNLSEQEQLHSSPAFPESPTLVLLTSFLPHLILTPHSPSFLTLAPFSPPSLSLPPVPSFFSHPLPSLFPLPPPALPLFSRIPLPPARLLSSAHSLAAGSPFRTDCCATPPSAARAPPRRRRAWRAAAAEGAGEANAGAAPLVSAAGDGAVRAGEWQWGRGGLRRIPSSAPLPPSPPPTSPLPTLPHSPIPPFFPHFPSPTFHPAPFPLSRLPSPPVSATRSGLFRSPVSGGVESATSAHGLPAPAVAVRNLVEQAQYAQLCSIMSRSHHRRKGYPFGSLVDFTTDADGHPVFLLSPLGMHSRNLQSDPRCTVVVQIPGWSGLANARATIFGDLYPLPPSQQEWARGFYVKRHQHGAAQQWGNFHFYRMDTICDIYFVGGFGTVAWIDVAEYVAATPDTVATNHVEHTLQELNDRLGADLRAVLAGSSPQQAIDDASFISIDSKGVDIRVRHGTQFHVQRLSFTTSDAVDSLPAAEAALRRILACPSLVLPNGTPLL